MTTTSSSSPVSSPAPSPLVLQGLTAPLSLADFKLAAFDMDSTLITIECIDEIAAAAGRKDEVAAITEAAMRGEITDFKDSLRRRLALLQGVGEDALAQVLRERLRFNPGARELCAALKSAGLTLVLVSGGFTYFTRFVAAELGMDFVRSNELEIVDGRLTGGLVMQDWGDICDGEEKRRMMLACADRVGATPAQCIAVGDGANDLPMMGAAGLSVAYHAKPKVRAQAMVAINDGGLDRLLDVLR
ncbi:phosphoserine phosphatase SerB [Mitsuaria sp. GD03876]|uniref:phosphoserine phosphatase SerB n=1 Tax=Mitsuaria sp. GD03876 TaxID=2975399 RepID=UPI0024493E40|nr:phosphoserine phosphatase SerB [Mitsuaria sp. GD03876]MDH0866242.1 phosphoserine phosphatase SerB [Mitsuaria sp. GD03876]